MVVAFEPAAVIASATLLYVWSPIFATPVSSPAANTTLGNRVKVIMTVKNSASHLLFIAFIKPHPFIRILTVDKKENKK